MISINNISFIHDTRLRAQYAAVCCVCMSVCVLLIAAARGACTRRSIVSAAV